jgi:hypothetical protein
MPDWVYYGELHANPPDLGYDVHFVNLAKFKNPKPINFYNGLKEIKPDMSLKKVAKIFPVVLKMFEYIDEAEDFIRKNVGFECTTGSFDKVHADFLKDLRMVTNKKELNSILRMLMKRLRSARG